MGKPSITTKSILDLLHRQGFKCAYSGDPLTPENTSADHRIPVSANGEHSIENIALVTRQVNAAKGTLSLVEFVQMCHKVSRHLSNIKESPIPSADDTSDDPVELLTRYGHTAAAQAVIEMQDNLDSLRKIKLRLDGTHREITDERIEERRQVHAKLQRDIQHLQVKRSKLLAQTGASISDLPE